MRPFASLRRTRICTPFPRLDTLSTVKNPKSFSKLLYLSSTAAGPSMSIQIRGSLFSINEPLAKANGSYHSNTTNDKVHTGGRITIKNVQIIETPSVLLGRGRKSNLRREYIALWPTICTTFSCGLVCQVSAAKFKHTSLSQRLSCWTFN